MRRSFQTANCAIGRASDGVLLSERANTSTIGKRHECPDGMAAPAHILDPLSNHASPRYLMAPAHKGGMDANPHL
jgi:hypothetical protein